MSDAAITLFSLNISRDLGERVAEHLGVALSPHEEREFEDGEHKVRSLTNVRGQDVYVIQSLYGESHASVNERHDPSADGQCLSPPGCDQSLCSCLPRGFC